MELGESELVDVTGKSRVIKLESQLILVEVPLGSEPESVKFPDYDGKKFGAMFNLFETKKNHRYVARLIYTWPNESGKVCNKMVITAYSKDCKEAIKHLYGITSANIEKYFTE